MRAVFKVDLVKDENIFLSKETSKYLCDQIVDGVIPSHFSKEEAYHAIHYYYIINPKIPMGTKFKQAEK